MLFTRDMGRKSVISVILALSILANVFCLPADLRLKRQTTDYQATTTAKSNGVTISENSEAIPPEPYNDDDDSFETQAPSGGGSNISSLFSLLGAFLPGSSSSNKLQVILHKVIKEFIKINKPRKIIKRDISDNKIDVDYPKPYSKQEIEEINSESDESDDTSEEKENEMEEDSDSNVESEEEYDEPPGGDGQGGGLLGLLAGLSGGEDGQSDLGSLLATISGIVANLSGDGIDLNSLIASGIGLFVGLLSEGEENPGAVIASYLLTSLDTITGGGSKNNGKFFGTFLSKLIKGTSAALDPDASSEEEGRVPPKDSVGFFVSLLAGLLGDMSGGSSAPHRRRLTGDNL